MIRNLNRTLLRALHPVFHKNQIEKTIVALAELLNASKIVHKELGDFKIVISGIGASGVIILKFLIRAVANLKNSCL